MDTISVTLDLLSDLTEAPEHPFASERARYSHQKGSDMAYQLPQNEKKSGPRNERLGNIAITVESFDRDTNTVHGFDPKTGEELSIRMATREEFADIYVNRDRFTTEESRRQQAINQTRRQPTVGGMANNVAGDTVVLQMQSVVRKPDGELVARWMNALNTQPEIDAYRPGYIDVHIPKSNEETKGAYERRFASVVFTDDTEAATMAALDHMTSNRIRGLEGNVLEGRIRSAVMVAVSDGLNTDTALLRTAYDRETKDFVAGGAALLEQPATKFSWKAQTALAAMVDKPFRELRFNDDVSKDEAAEIYQAVQDGYVSVAITPAVQADLMPQITDKIVKLENSAAKDDGATARMSGRKFYEADISFRSMPAKDDFPATTNIKEIMTTGFLKPENDPNHVAIRLADLGAQSIVKAGGHDALVKPEAKQAAQVTAEAEQRAQAEQTRHASFAPATNSM